MATSEGEANHGRIAHILKLQHLFAFLLEDSCKGYHNNAIQHNFKEVALCHSLAAQHN